MNQAVRIVGVSSSPRHGSTEVMLEEALNAARAAYPQVSVEKVSFMGKRISSCCDCKACERRAEDSLIHRCVLEDDWVELMRPLVDPVPNGLILASPVYFADVNSQMRAFMERCTSVIKPYWFPGLPFEPPDFSGTAGGALAVGFNRNGGQETAILNMLRFMLIMGMPVVGSFCQEYGPVGFYGGTGWEDCLGNAERKSVKQDQWGLYSARTLGRKVAYTAIMLAEAPKHSQVSETFDLRPVGEDQQ